MSWDELSYRLRDRFNGYFHSEKRSVKVLSRLMAFTLFAAIISTIAPTLADELSSDPSMMQPVNQSSESYTVSVGESATASPTPDATLSPEPVVNRPPVSNESTAPLPESSDSATAAGPGLPLEIQPTYTLKIPRTIAIDPRALHRYLPLIYASQPDPDIEFTMVCISGPGLRIDAMAKNVANFSDEGAELISGDQSGQVIISATTNRVINLINSSNGLFISSQSGGLAGRSITFRFLAVTKPVVDPIHCGAAQSGAITAFRPLALDLSTVKGGGSLK